MIQLGVNIDHIATLRNARGEKYPSLATAAGIAEQNGADFITIHLREDRRHIKEQDLYILKECVTTYLNLEMACNDDVLAHALKAKPLKATLVPERRQEITTEGGLNVRDNLPLIADHTGKLQKAGIIVSLFVEADINEIDNFKKTGAVELEIHTGKYAASLPYEKEILLSKIKDFAKEAKSAGFKICAGHGLNYHNVKEIAMIKEITELNIGHAIISRAIFTGLGPAVREMRDLMNEARPR